MSTPPKQVSAPPTSPPPAAGQLFGNCWGCRLLSGGGLLAAAGFVYMAARRVMRQGGPTTPGIVAQIAFAASLAAWGVVVITDPVGKSSKKT